TLGCFQLESNLGKTFAKKLKPENIEHLSALVAILRPGSLDSLRDGKSITQHYIDRKNGKEEITYYHPALEPILKTTYAEMIFQEQSMSIAKEIAGFSLQKADMLRKAIGKKIPALMTKLESEFVNGCKDKGIVTEEQGKEIFEWIRASQKYQFNRSHSVSYALNTYLSAYAKAHFTKAFITAYLYYAKGKQKPFDEINALANNAKALNIEIKPPDLRYLNTNFKLIDGVIYFGLTDIKGIGQSVINRLQKTTTLVVERLKKSLDKFTWLDFLIFISQGLTSTGVKALISTGALDYMGISRSRMLYEYDLYNKLSGREQKWCESTLFDKGNWNGGYTSSIQNLSNVLALIIKAPTGRQGGCANKNRLIKLSSLLDMLNDTPYQLVDSPEWVSNTEESLLGISLTHAVVESCDINAANCTCKEWNSKLLKSKIALIAVSID
ncbi:hypothetical protein LCGC14_2685780, partial [marine sediment metagenome]